MKIYGLQKLTLLDYPGKIACTVFLGGCNMRCPFCHNGSLALGQGGVLMDTEELLAFLDARRGRLQGVCISGGEPTLYSDLPDLLAEIKARGFDVKLDTNGTNPELLSSLIFDGLVDYVAMDIKNSPEKYAATAGHKGAMINSVGGPAAYEFELTKMAAIRDSAALLMVGRVDFEFRTTVVDELHSVEDMESIGRWLCGGEKYFLQTYREGGDQLVGGFTPPSKEKMDSLLETLKKYIPNATLRG